VGGTAFLNPIGDSYLGMSGNTGVGTQSPSSKLDVAGNAALTIGGFHGIFTHADTANRTYTFPDASGTVCLTSTCGSGGGNVSSSGTPTAGQVAQWVTSTTIKGSTALAYRTCTMVIAGTGAGGVLQSSDISATLDGQDCELVGAGTLVEVDVRVDGGTSSVLLGRDRAGTVANIVSAALAGGGAGTATCSNTSATTGAISGLTCAGTLQNTSLNAGDWLGVVSGTPDGTTKRVSISIVYQLS